jgi:hypothetical protein
MGLEPALAEVDREPKRREKLAHLFPRRMHAIVFSSVKYIVRYSRVIA